jgi:hypothetical protein
MGGILPQPAATGKDNNAMQGNSRRTWRPAAIALAAMLAIATTAAQQPARRSTPQRPQAGAPSAPTVVRLRLANSLCTSNTMQTLAMQRVPPLASNAPADASVNSGLARGLEEQRDAYFGRLEAIHPFDGLYAAGTADHTFLGPDFGGRYSLGLEWELLDRGRGEARRQLERARLEGKAQYLQLLHDTRERELQEQLLAIEQMRNKLLATLYQREAAAIAPVLERRRQELAAGQITRSDLADMETRAEIAQLRARQYAALPDVLVYPQALDLVNRIESVELRPTPELATLAAQRSPDIELQTLLGERATFLPSVRDHTQASVYVERARDFDRAPYNVAGVRVRIPLDRDRGRDEVVEATRELFATQRESLRASLGQRIEMLAQRLRLRQNDMRVLQAQSELLRRKVETACYRLDHPVAALAGQPDLDLEDLSVQLQELQTQILSARLDVFALLMQVSALVQPRDPQELYSLAK